MATIRRAGSSSTAIQQRITAGNRFDGTLPTGDSPLGAAPNSPIYKYAPQAAGGLFYWDVNESVICGQFHIYLGGSGDVRVFLVNLDPASVAAGTPTVIPGESILIEESTGVNFVALDESKFRCLILPFQALQLVTTVSGAAQIAQAVASIERTFVR